ncbi:hypothetical protein [Bradyrhizobium guangdongense]|nr:hypothetical protein [Bradyrhizobium guangdongense]
MTLLAQAVSVALSRNHLSTRLMKQLLLFELARFFVWIPAAIRAAR